MPLLYSQILSYIKCHAIVFLVFTTITRCIPKKTKHCGLSCGSAEFYLNNRTESMLFFACYIGHTLDNNFQRSQNKLDFLPYKVPEQPRKKIGWIRYIVFVVSLVFVSALFLAHVGNIEKIMFWAFIIGNILYYAVGIILAFAFKDNRAFCKYICPITVFMKPMSFFSLFRIKCDTSKCISCGKCKTVCPMDVDMTDNSRKRQNGTDCILCFECTKVCPKKAL